MPAALALVLWIIDVFQILAETPGPIFAELNSCQNILNSIVMSRDSIVIYWGFIVISWKSIVIYWDFIVISWDLMVI